jgi:hypothetical protein
MSTVLQILRSFALAVLCFYLAGLGSALAQTPQTPAATQAVTFTTDNPQWGPGIKESSGTAYTCPGGGVMVGMRHSGDENGYSYYECAGLLPAPVTQRECAWSNFVKENQGYYSCPDNKVMIGRQHYRDENGDTRYQCCNLVYGQEAPVYLEASTCGWSPSQRQSSTDYTCPQNEVMTARDHQGDENGPTSYYCCALTTDSARQMTAAPKRPAPSQ